MEEVSFVLFDWLIEHTLITETIEKVSEGNSTFLKMSSYKFSSTSFCVKCEQVSWFFLERITQIPHHTEQLLDLVCKGLLRLAGLLMMSDI